MMDGIEYGGTRRVLVSDEVYCPDCLIVSRDRDAGHDRPGCPLCGGPVQRAGYVVQNLPGVSGVLPPPWGRAVN